MPGQFTLAGSEPSPRSVVFRDVQRPHGDELTFFVAHVVGESLDASCSVESLAGDSGFELGSRPADPGKVSSLGEPLRLSEFFVELGSGPLWKGLRNWRSLGGELEVALSVDRLGHVDVRFQISPQPWKPTWSATCTLRYDLGDLQRVGTELGQWFDRATRSEDA